jgi:hypothetical protein
MLDQGGEPVNKEMRLCWRDQVELAGSTAAHRRPGRARWSPRRYRFEGRRPLRNDASACATTQRPGARQDPSFALLLMLGRRRPRRRRAGMPRRPPGRSRALSGRARRPCRARSDSQRSLSEPCRHTRRGVAIASTIPHVVLEAWDPADRSTRKGGRDAHHRTCRAVPTELPRAGRAGAAREVDLGGDALALPGGRALDDPP